MSKSIKDLVLTTCESFSYKYEHRDEPEGLFTGFYDLDTITNGLHKSELTVIAGRPAIGKTSLALNICGSLVKANTPCLFISYEMNDKKLTERLLCQEAVVDKVRLKTGNMTAKDWERFTDAMNLFGELHLEIIGSCQFDIAELTDEIKRFHEQNPDGVVFIDYFQLIKLKGEQDRYVELSSIACTIKHLAMELDIPIILMSQVSRKCEDGFDKRPELGDMFECDSLSCHADNVIFIYRDEMYNRENTENKGKAELIFAKHRNGPIGTIDLLFQASITKFKNITKTNVF